MIDDCFFQESRLEWMAKILEERFGHKWRLASAGGQLILKLVGEPGQVVFDCLEPAFMQPGKPRGLRCEWWKVESSWHSVLYEPTLPAPSSQALQQPLIELNGTAAICHYDILGLAFWTMNRLEEIGAEILDEHQRFPASESHAVQHDYLDRPLVDEWLHILGQVILAQWPQIRLIDYDFELVLSHDVDVPSRYGFRSLSQLFRATGGDLIKRRDLKSAFLAPWIRLNTRQSLHPLDPFNTFHWIMDQSENAGVKSTFNFISETRFGAFEPDYTLEHPAIRKLIKDIHQKGHQIGLHPSYGSFVKAERIRDEFERLKEVCDDEGVVQAKWGGRMHYLQWSHPDTVEALSVAGLDYDSTLSFASQAGFRCGTCHEYPVFDAVQNKQLSIREKPLIAMEQSVLSPKYMGVTTQEEARSLLLSLKQKCRLVSGKFCLLWHNSELFDKNRRKLYHDVIQ